MTRPSRPARVAVVGSGVAGLVAAYVASRTGHVTLYEADDRLGGHADTHDVVEHRSAAGDADVTLGIDTGFIVHNPRTYPVLLRLFAELGVATHPSEMSMSIKDEATGLEWAGALGRRGLFPTSANLGNPRYLAMLVEIPWFHRQAARLLEADPPVVNGRDREQTLREFLADGHFSAYFTRHFMEPLVAAVWSCDPEVALDYPARYLFTFLRHHGMLGVFGSPQWRTVTGGSRAYVDAVATALADAGSQVRLGVKVTSVLETPSGVEVTDGSGATATYDAVVLAAHPHQSLAMLAEPTPAQREVLGAMPYSPNTALLHTDASLMPHARDAWASWNFQRPSTELARSRTQAQRSRGVGADLSSRRAARHVSRPPEPAVGADRWDQAGAHAAGISARSMTGGPARSMAQDGSGQPAGVLVTYDLTRLQRLNTDVHYFVTLGGAELVDPTTVIARMEYEHPLYNPTSVAAQQRLPELDSDRVGFAGAYHGWGFHEDGARSGLAAAERLGLAWPSDVPTSPADEVPTGSYATTISHTRRTPWRRTFTHRSTTWVVDLDDLPDHGVLGRFEARDHFGPPTGLGSPTDASVEPSIKADVVAFLARHEIDLTGGRVVMAANARALGYCFNPISVFWCWDRDGRDAATVVEVHNTYGDRHAYLVHPDGHGRARTDKAMYVSPFHGTDGCYDLVVPVPDGRLEVVVTLRAEDGTTFSAALRGRRAEVSPVRTAVAAIRHSVLIRTHGVWLWLRRLPIRPRPAHDPQHRPQPSPPPGGQPSPQHRRDEVPAR